VAEDDAYVSYLEGCTAPAYDSNQLHAAVVELSTGANAEIKYSTVQNWCAPCGARGARRRWLRARARARTPALAGRRRHTPDTHNPRRAVPCRAVPLCAHTPALCRYAGDADGRGGIYNFVTKRGLCHGANSKISWTQVCVCAVFWGGGGGLRRAVCFVACAAAACEAHGDVALRAVPRAASCVTPPPTLLTHVTWAPAAQVETGSAITWKYPSVVLKGDGSVGEFYSVALTNHKQQADTGKPAACSECVCVWGGGGGGGGGARHGAGPPRE
jgi:Fe-S cluster assembly scaffold protein SufB